MVDVVIVGGGFSGTMVAAQLLRADPNARIALVEERKAVGRGLAYSTDCEHHLLNVPAGRMSAWPDRPDHFVQWLASIGRTYATTDFVPRSLFGRYVSEQLEGDRLHVIHQRAIHATRRGPGCRVRLRGGAELSARALVLALGNPPPANLVPLSHPAVVQDPWAPGVLRQGPSSGTVMLLGTGLTMVDVAVAMDANGYRGPFVALSRHGLLPQAHSEAPVPAWTVRPNRCLDRSCTAGIQATPRATLHRACWIMGVEC